MVGCTVTELDKALKALADILGENLRWIVDRDGMPARLGEILRWWAVEEKA